MDRAETSDRPGRPPAAGRGAGPHGPRGWQREPRAYPPGPPRAVEEVDTAGLFEEDAELVAGRRPVEEAFAARREARRLLVVPQRRAALEALVLHATTLRIPVVEVEGGTLTSLAGFDGHQGVALVTGPRRWATLDEVVARALERGERPFVVALDSLEDPQNMGTLLRAAEAAGVHGVVFPTRRSAPLSPAAVKASAGAVEHLLLVPVDDLPAALSELHGRGLRLVGAEAEAPLGYRDADLRGPIVLVVGSEGHGLSAAIRRRLDVMVRIPMAGRVASLNAAVAGAILLFEAAGQRGTPERERPPEPTTPAADEPTAQSPVPAESPDGPATEPPAEPAAEAPAKSARKRATRARAATEPPAAEAGTEAAPAETAPEQAPDAAALGLLPGEPGTPAEG